MSDTIPIPDDLIGLAEAARLIPSRKAGKKVHTTSIARWVRDGRLPGYRIGRHLFVSRRELLAFVRPAATLRPEIASRRQREAEIAAAEKQWEQGWS